LEAFLAASVVAFNAFLAPAFPADTTFLAPAFAALPAEDTVALPAALTPALAAFFNLFVCVVVTLIAFCKLLIFK